MTLKIEAYTILDKILKKSAGKIVHHLTAIVHFLTFKTIADL
jgi:hypothetical protein